MKFTRITVNPRQMDGVPCIRGLRIPVSTIVGMVADGMTTKDILAILTSEQRIFVRPYNMQPKPSGNANCH